MLSCIKYRKKLIRYVEGSLTDGLMRNVEAHLHKCSSCAQEVEDLQSVSLALKRNDLPPAEPSPNLWLKIQSQIEQPSPAARPWWQGFSFQAASAAGVAVVVLLAVMAVHTPLHIDDRNDSLQQKAQTQQMRQQAQRHVEPSEQLEKSDTASSQTPTSKPVQIARGTTDSSAQNRYMPAPTPRASKVRVSTKPKLTPLDDKGVLPGMSAPAAPGLGYTGVPSESVAQVPAEIYADRSVTKSIDLKPPAEKTADSQDVRIAMGGETILNSNPLPGRTAGKASPASSAAAPGTVGSMNDKQRMNQATQMAANVCVSTGELDKEIKDREKLSKTAPKNARNWLALGKAYERANNRLKAKEAFKKAVEFGDDAIKREAEDNLKRLGS